MYLWRRVLIIVAGLLAILPTATFAIQKSQSPVKFPIPWGNSAANSYIRTIPVPSQIGVVNGAASLTDGFPPLNFLPAGSGGIPPFGQDFNGILQQITQWSRWYSAGGPIFFDSTFASSAANGYPVGAIVQSTVVPGNFNMSIVDNNTANPDTGGAGWEPLPSAFQTGDVKWVFNPSVTPGWVLAINTQSLGSATSGATVAGPQAQFLFTLLWGICPNTLCTVSGGRGANAAADFAANKTIQMFNLSGSLLIGSDNFQGVLTGVPVISGGGINSPTSTIGAVFNTLSVANLPAHTHAYSNGGSGTTSTDSPDHTHNSDSRTAYFPGGAPSSFATGTAATVSNAALPTSGASNRHTHTFSYSFSGNTDNCGACVSTPVNSIPRAMVGYWLVKL